MTIYQRILVLTLLVLPSVALADFNRNLYFGFRNDPEVKALQEFLIRQEVYAGPVNGSFFSLTKEAVKKFQQREKIEPASGYFGVKTRLRANVLNSSQPSPSSREDLIVFLTARVKTLQDQLKFLQ